MYVNEIEIKLTLKERDLIINHTYADPGLTKRLQIAEIKGKNLIQKYTIDELDILLGFIAAEENHTKDKTLGRSLSILYDKLSRIFDKYE